MVLPNDWAFALAALYEMALAKSRVTAKPEVWLFERQVARKRPAIPN
jgi:hypothetical protein